MEYNNELKHIDSESKSYLLGLFYADGCISTQNTVRISLIDEQLINDLHILFPFFNKINFDYSIYNSNNKIQYSLTKQGKEIYKDFVNNGLFRRKSTENAEKLKLPNINKDLLNHFIRGYFDGNGSISISTKRPNLRRIEICSSSLTFITSIKNYLESIGINCPIFRKKQNTNSILYVLEWVNSKDIFLLKDFLYNNSTISLKRKQEKFDSFKIIDKTDENPKCKNCGGNLVKNGKRQMAKGLALRYECKKCNINSTILINPSVQ